MEERLACIDLRCEANSGSHYGPAHAYAATGSLVVLQGVPAAVKRGEGSSPKRMMTVNPEHAPYFLLLVHRVDEVDGVEDATVVLGHAQAAAAAAAHPAVELQGPARVFLAPLAQRRQLGAQGRGDGLPRCPLAGLAEVRLEQFHHLGQGGVNRQGSRPAEPRQRADFAAQRAGDGDDGPAAAIPRLSAGGTLRLAVLSRQVMTSRSRTLSWGRRRGGKRLRGGPG